MRWLSEVRGYRFVYKRMMPTNVKGHFYQTFDLIPVSNGGASPEEKQNIEDLLP